MEEKLAQEIFWQGFNDGIEKRAKAPKFLVNSMKEKVPVVNFIRALHPKYMGGGYIPEERILRTGIKKTIGNKLKLK